MNHYIYQKLAENSKLFKVFSQTSFDKNDPLSKQEKFFHILPFDDKFYLSKFYENINSHYRIDVLCKRFNNLRKDECLLLAKQLDYLDSKDLIDILLLILFNEIDYSSLNENLIRKLDDLQNKINRIEDRIKHNNQETLVDFYENYCQKSNMTVDDYINFDDEDDYDEDVDGYFNPNVLDDVRKVIFLVLILEEGGSKDLFKFIYDTLDDHNSIEYCFEYLGWVRNGNNRFNEKYNKFINMVEISSDFSD